MIAMMEDFACVWETIKAWGPGILLALFMLYGFYKLLFKIAMGVGLKIVAALEKPAASMDRLTSSIQDYVNRDQNEHRQIMIMLKVISKSVENLREEKDGV